MEFLACLQRCSDYIQELYDIDCMTYYDITASPYSRSFWFIIGGPHSDLSCSMRLENLSAQLSLTQAQSATQEECLQAQTSKMSKLEALRIQIDTRKW